MICFQMIRFAKIFVKRMRVVDKPTLTRVWLAILEIIGFYYVKNVK